MNRIVIFAGTTEGRILSEGLSGAGIPHTVCVATDYGELMMKPDPCVTVKSGRMEEAEMEQFLKTSADIVYDATHPFATVVTKNIKEACEKTGVSYIRVLRAEQTGDAGNAYLTYFESTEECAKALSGTEGNILLTTGSKEVSVYASVEGVKERLFARVLPSEESIRLCNGAGIQGKQILAMHGPFSAELNEALIRQFDIRCLVTKQSGLTGGYYEKLKAAEQTGISVFVIGRPEEEAGVSVEEVLKDYGVSAPLKVTLIGCGPGREGLLTVEAQKAIAAADVVFGSARLIENIAGKRKYPYYLAKDVIPVLEEGSARNAVVLFSGDSGFFSGTAKMREELCTWAEQQEFDVQIEVYPGISSLVYLASKAHESYQEFPFLSMHGRSDERGVFANVIRQIRQKEKVFLILSGAADVVRLGKALTDGGLGNCEVILGYELSYPEEEILHLTPEECMQITKKGLYAAIVKNPSPERARLVPFLSDEDFVRTADPASGTKPDAPMTKEMIRHASLIRLDLSAGDILYDVGSGTGSVSVEAALLDPSVTVYAVEKKEKAAALSKINIEKFGCVNIQVVQGEAPAAFAGLEPPTHVFIGGSGGNMKEILDAVKEKNPQAKIVVNAITLETIAEINEVLKSIPHEDLIIEQLAVSTGRKLGSYHLMTAENPIYIFSFRLVEKHE